MENKTYLEKLEDWFQAEKAAGQIADLKLTLKTWAECEEDLGRLLSQEEKSGQLERTAKAIYETVTGKRKCIDMTNVSI